MLVIDCGDYARARVACMAEVVVLFPFLGFDGSTSSPNITGVVSK